MVYEHPQYFEMFQLAIERGDYKELVSKYPIFKGHEKILEMLIKLLFSRINTHYDVSMFFDGLVEFIRTIGDKEYELSPDYLLFLMASQNIYYNYYLACLMCGKEYFKRNPHGYIYYFTQMISNRIMRPLADNIELEDPKLQKLSEVTREIKNRYYVAYLENMSCADTILARCYCYDNYDYIFKFLKNPNYYMERIVMNGYLGIEKSRVAFLHEKFPNLSNSTREKIFRKSKILFQNDETKII